jgi:hypothetical protein
MASDMSDFDPTTSTDSDNSCLFKIQKAVTCKDDSFFFVEIILFRKFGFLLIHAILHASDYLRQF